MKHRQNIHRQNMRGAAFSTVLAALLMLSLMACATSTTPTPEAVETAVAATSEPAAPAESAGEAEGDQATLVVQLDDSRTLIRKVSFSAPISGLALLDQSGLELGKAELSWGTAVCSIEGIGCPVEDCFCHENIFWGYLTWQGDSWASYPIGPGQSLITTTGMVEGWQWGTGATPPAAPQYAVAAHDALQWLASGQVITDGSYANSPSASVETLLALGANHLDAAAWRIAADAPSLLDFVREEGAEYSQDGVSEAGKLAVGLSAANACWPTDAVKPSAYYSPTLGALHTDAGPLAWGILGTLALDEPRPEDSIDYLRGLALPDGGWEWSPGWGRDTNSTALALQALVAAGTPVTDSVVASGQMYLLSGQSEEGGFGYDPNAAWGNVADANSTAYVLQALAALGVGTEARADALDYLIALQHDDGALGWQVAQPAPNLSATQQAIPALLGQPYPIRRVALLDCE